MHDRGVSRPRRFSDIPRTRPLTDDRIDGENYLPSDDHQDVVDGGKVAGIFLTVDVAGKTQAQHAFRGSCTKV